MEEGKGAWIVPWISRMARPEGVWRSWGRGFVVGGVVVGEAGV